MDKEKGQLIIELLVAMAIFISVVSATAFLILDSYVANRAGGEMTQSTFLAQEGLEAARAIRDSGWNNLTAGSHGLSVSGNNWIFSGSQEDIGTKLNQGTRQIIIENIDSDRKKITCQVAWQFAANRSQNVTLTTYLTNWQKLGIGNWLNPTREAGLNIAGTNDGLKIQAQGNFAYLVRNGGSPNFIIIDVTNTASPLVVSSLTLSGTPKNIWVAGNYAYVASTADNRELQIIDISNPSLPSLAGFYNAVGSADANGIYVVGSTAYLTRTSSTEREFLIINISEPTLPTLMGSLDLAATGYEVVALGDFAFVASGHNSQELQVVNISNPASPALAGWADISGTTDAITIIGFGATVIVGRGNLAYLFDVSSPVAPVQIGSFNYLGTVNDFSLGNSNNYLFSATSRSDGEFKVVDISASGSPFLLGTYNVSGNNPLFGIAYQEANDRVFGAGSLNTEEFIVIKPQ